MNCDSCLPNYYIYDETKSCYKNGTDNFYLDKNNKLQKCHENCTQCISNENKNCTKCKSNLYLTEDAN